jgi:hypothetical protein
MMDIEEIAYSLPSTQAFLDAIARSVVQNVVIVLLPDNLSREMVGRLVRNRLDMIAGFSFGELTDPGQSDPLAASAEAMNASWESDRTRRNIENLLCCADLPDLLYVNRIGSDGSRWSDFIEGWANERLKLRNSGRAKAPSLCVIAKLRDFGFRLPQTEEGITYQWWWGFPSTLEMRLACRIVNEQDGNSFEVGRWREHIVPGLVGSDVQLALEIWTEVDKDIEHTIGSLRDFWANGEEPATISSMDALVEAVKNYQGAFAIGQELPKDFWEPWAKGRLVYTPEHGLEVHPALLAHSGHRVEVEKRLWRGQAELLLPVLNEIRLRICAKLTDAYGSDWPFKWREPASGYDLEQVKITPLATELGHIHYLFTTADQGHPLNAVSHLSGLVLNARNMRNQVAHNKPVVYRDFELLCQKRNRVGC